VADTDRIGQILAGKLRLVGLLGTGGMGAVYAAEHLQLGKRVAVKFLRADQLTDQESVQRFSQEARAAAAIGHRGIIDVYDIGTSDDGAPYLVMELLEGESLGQAIERTPVFPVDLAVWVMLRVLSALRAAHETGIVHRDLKPDNVFLVGPRGTPDDVKLLDFGISKMVGEGDRKLTGPGVAVGTVDYMAPEQARGAKDLDHRVDVWAAGVILYQLVTGRHPFGEASDSYLEILSRILSQAPVAPRVRRPDLPEGLEAAILKALAKDRDRRCATALELAEAIAPWAGDLSHPGDVESRSRLREAVTQKAEALAPAEPAPGRATDQAARAVRGRVGPLGRALLVAAALGVGGVAAWAVTPGPREERASRPAATTPRKGAPDAPRPPAAARAGVVHIEVAGAPDAAKVFFDGAEVEGRSIRVAPRNVMVPLRVEAPGHEAFAKMITPDRDQRIEVVLRPIVRAPRRRPPETPRGTRILTDTEEFGRSR